MKKSITIPILMVLMLLCSSAAWAQDKGMRVTVNGNTTTYNEDLTTTWNKYVAIDANRGKAVTVELDDENLTGENLQTKGAYVPGTEWNLAYTIDSGSSETEPLISQTNYKVATLDLTQGQNVTFHVATVLNGKTTTYGPSSDNTPVAESEQAGYQYSANSNNFTFTAATTGKYTFVVRDHVTEAKDKVYVFPEEATYTYTGYSEYDIYISALYEGQKIKVVFDNYNHPKIEPRSCFNMYAHAANTQFTLVFKGDNLLDGDNHGGIKMPMTPHQSDNVTLFATNVMITCEGTSTVQFGSGDNNHCAIQDELGSKDNKPATFEMDPDCMYMYFEGTRTQEQTRHEFIPENVDEMANALKEDYVKAMMLLAKPYERTVNTSNYGSICLPYTTTKDEWTNIETVYSITNITNEQVTLTEVADGMEMGKPYIFKASKSPIRIKRQQTTDFVPTASSSAIGSTGSTYHGTFYNAYAPKDSYVLQSNTFKKVTAKNQIKLNYRGYLTLSGSNARELSIMGEGEETAIDALNAVIDGSAQIYDLNGRRLPALQKGINIVNGKKIVVR